MNRNWMNLLYYCWHRKKNNNLIEKEEEEKEKLSWASSNDLETMIIPENVDIVLRLLNDGEWDSHQTSSVLFSRVYRKSKRIVSSE